MSLLHIQSDNNLFSEVFGNSFKVIYDNRYGCKEECMYKCFFT